MENIHLPTGMGMSWRKSIVLRRISHEHIFFIIIFFVPKIMARIAFYLFGSSNNTIKQLDDIGQLVNNLATHYQMLHNHKHVKLKH